MKNKTTQTKMKAFRC